MIDVHPSSVIDRGAIIGKGTRIWHFSHIRESARIGENCVIGEHVYIGPNVTIGNGVKIQNNVSVYEGVTLEDDVFVGPSVVFTNVINPRSFVERKHEFRATLVKVGASLGANCTVLCGTVIGSFSLIGAGSVVTNEVLDFALVRGNPAKQVAWVSQHGEKLELPLCGHTTSSCPATNIVYELIDGRVHRH